MRARHMAAAQLWTLVLLGGLADTSAQTTGVSATHGNPSALTPSTPVVPSAGVDTFTVTMETSQHASATHGVTATGHVSIATTDPTINPSFPEVETSTQPSGYRASGPKSACPCDLTPGLCDISCCCDGDDCGVSDLSSIFSGCTTEERFAVCLESACVFRANVDPALIQANESYFCVRGDEVGQTDQQTTRAVTQLPVIQESFLSLQSFIPPAKPFYKADDVLLTSYGSSTLWGLFRQPSPGATTSVCSDRNPARFLRSLTVACTRAVTAEACLSEPSLDAHSYYSGISLLRAPFPQNVSAPGFTIPILPVSDWPRPSVQNGSCLNVVSEVQYVVVYTSGGLITSVTVNVTLTKIDGDSQLLQRHACLYQLSTPPHTAGPGRAVGLMSKAPVIGRFSGRHEPLTVQGTSGDGGCSSLPQERRTVLFRDSYMTGCVFSIPLENCSSLREELYKILQSGSPPELVAMNSGSQPDWTRVIVEDCSNTPTEDLCDVGCLIPLSLTIQFLWAKRGLLSLPQSEILGVKYLFRCQEVQCPLTSPITVMTEVQFSDATIYPPPARGRPQPQWKFPFGFFSRGREEQDYGVAVNRCGHWRAVWDSAWIIAFFHVLLRHE